MTTYRLDRSKFKAQTANEAANHSSYYKSLTWQERLKVAAFLNTIAFDYPLDSPPRMDRTKFQAKSRKNEK